MKKIYSLALLAFASMSFGQNLVTNPTFDDGLNGWTAGPTTSYALPTLVAGDGSDSTNSVQYVATATTGFYQEVPVTAGSSITVSFWYKATGDGTDARIWSNYKDDAGTIIYQDATTTNDPLRNNNTYLATATTWTNVSIPVTVPAGATKLVLAVRAYNGGTVSYDQFSVVSSTASVNNASIAGLKVFANNKILYVTSDSSDDKSVVVYDMIGKVVVNETVSSQPVNVANLSTGAYIVKVTENGATSTVKVLID